MKQLEIQTKLTIYNSKEALSETTRSLFLEAEKARERAYAPYSHFRVGAALLMSLNHI